MKEEYTIEHSMCMEDLFDSIAQELQNDNDLDLSYDEIVEQLQSNSDFNRFIDVSFRVSVNLDTKKIEDIY